MSIIETRHNLLSLGH